MKDASQNNNTWMIPSVICFFISLILLMCFKYDTIYPQCLILLAVFTISLTCIISFIAAQTTPSVVIQALFLCFSVVLGVTTYVFTTKVNFSFFGPIPFSLGFVLGTYGIMYLLCNMRDASVFFSMIGAVVFIFYLIGDTILLMRGASFCFLLTRERHILCAVSLYLDVINIFIYLLAMLGD